MHLVVAVATLLTTTAAIAQPLPFTGKWHIDIRNEAQRQRGAECGSASFELIQVKDSISGSHSMATVDCGRLNEGEPGSVKGLVVKGIAVLTVASGRNGAIVLGTAELKGGKLHWQSREELRQGEPESDSPLILRSGVLVRQVQ